MISWKRYQSVQTPHIAKSDQLKVLSGENSAHYLYDSKTQLKSYHHRSMDELKHHQKHGFRCRDKSNFIML